MTSCKFSFSGSVSLQLLAIAPQCDMPGESALELHRFNLACPQAIMSGSVIMPPFAWITQDRVRLLHLLEHFGGLCLLGVGDFVGVVLHHQAPVRSLDLLLACLGLYTHERIVSTASQPLFVVTCSLEEKAGILKVDLPPYCCHKPFATHRPALLQIHATHSMAAS